jgi:hypothetical protein
MNSESSEEIESLQKISLPQTSQELYALNLADAQKEIETISKSMANFQSRADAMLNLCDLKESALNSKNHKTLGKSLKREIRRRAFKPLSRAAHTVIKSWSSQDKQLKEKFNEIVNVFDGIAKQYFNLPIMNSKD